MLYQHSLELVLLAVVTQLDCSFPIYRFTDLLQCEASQYWKVLSIAINNYYCIFRIMIESCLGILKHQRFPHWKAVSRLVKVLFLCRPGADLVFLHYFCLSWVLPSSFHNSKKQKDKKTQQQKSKSICQLISESKLKTMQLYLSVLRLFSINEVGRKLSSKSN